MAKEQLPEDRTVPPGSTPDNENVKAERELEDREAEPETEAAGPEEGEPVEPEPEAEPEAETEETPEEDSFEPNPEFAKKFGDEKGGVDWKKVHDSYLAAEKKLSQRAETPPEDPKLKQEAEFGRYTAYLVQKYPNLPVQAAHKQEQREQERAQQAARPQAINDIEEMSDDEVDERVNNLIAEGKNAQAQRLAARHTPEARAFRRNEKVAEQRERDEQNRQLREQDAKYKAEIAAIESKYGQQDPAIWGVMNDALAKLPPRFEVNVEDLYLLAKAKVGKKTPGTEPSKPPPGRVPRPGVQPVKPARKQPGVFGQSDEEYLAQHRSISLNDLMGKK